MQREIDVGTREAVEEPVLEHGLRPGAALLGGLSDHHEGSVPLVPERGETPCRTDEDGHVHVMAAGVHDVHMKSVLLGGFRRRGVSEPRHLLHRQGIEIGADEERRTVAVLHHADDAVSTDAGGDIEAEVLEFARDPLRGVGLLERQLGMGVEIVIEALEIAVVLIDRGVEPRARGTCRHRRHRCDEDGKDERDDPLHRLFPLIQ